jgi:hypothetical protein
MKPKIGVVLPTLGDRLELLSGCIFTIRRAGDTYISLVSPRELPTEITSLADEVIMDPGYGLAAAINLGIYNLPDDIEFATWIGDDDLFEENGLQVLAEFMNSDQYASLVYGICTYIALDGKILGVNKVGKIASCILSYGPDLIPQPSALFRRKDFEEVGGLNSIYSNSFDFDLFLRLKKIGTVKYVRVNVSKFRWHDGSLSVNQRWRAVIEASKVRRSHLTKLARGFSILWEVPVILLTYLAGRFVNYRAKSR